MDDIDSDLRHIRLDDPPRPKSLQLDRMFNRAVEWSRAQALASGSSSTSTFTVPNPRPPSPPRHRTIYPLPRPNSSGSEISPLAGLLDYPELIPHILDKFEHPRDLAVLARVSKTWCGLARKRLYEHIWIRPWEDGCHLKLVMLFQTLHTNRDLCSLIKKLDVRFFPLAKQGAERSELDEQVHCAVKHMTNLKHLVWTRDKSLNPELVETITQLDHLRYLEISGHANMHYAPRLIGQMMALEELRVMMPDSVWGHYLVDILKELAGRKMGGLKGLALVCRSWPMVDDKMLKGMAPHLQSLKRLTLWGCTRITREGVYEILRQAEDLDDLSLDALPHSDLHDLSRAPGLMTLQTLSMAVTAPTREFLELQDIPSLPPLPNLRNLHLTLSGVKKFIPQGGLEKLQSAVDSTRLRRLSLNNLVIGPKTLSTILTTSPVLEELYLTVNSISVIIDCQALSGLPDLRILHITTPERFGPTTEDLRVLAERLVGLDQIGAGNRVYEVFRRYPDGNGDGHGDGYDSESESESGGAEEMKVELGRWGRTTTPGYFQVWRG